MSPIYELSKSDSAIFTENLEKVFSSFVTFLEKVESKGWKNSEQMKQWIQHKDPTGRSVIIMLLNWVNWYHEYQEKLLSIKNMD